jgi:uncharacterized RDD family membrane protein YckC
LSSGQSAFAQSSVPLPPGIRFAPMGLRLGAWIIDMFLFGLLSLIPTFVAFASGAIRENPIAVQQLADHPDVQPTVPLLMVDGGPLTGVLALWVVLAIVYPAICWAWLRGLPGQRMLSIQVATPTGHSLPWWRAAVRSFAVNGIPAAASAVALYALMDLLGHLTPQELTTSQAAVSAYISESAFWTQRSLLLSVSWIACWAWPLALLITASINPAKRGLHDTLAGSIVVSGTRVSVGGVMASAVDRVVPAGLPGLAALAPAAPAAEETEGGADPQAAGLRKAWTPPEVDARVSEKLPDGLRLARFSRRIGAYAIDCGIMFGVFLVCSAVAETITGISATTGGVVPERLAMVAGLLGGIAQLVYFVVAWTFSNGTLGMKAAGLKIVSEKGEPAIDWIDSLVRWAVLQGPFALWSIAPFVIRGPIAIYGAFMIVFLVFSTRDNPDGQGLHDRLVGTMVGESV